MYRLATLLEFKLEAVEPGLASMALTVRDELRQNNGVVHGGAIATLIDSAAAFAIIPLLRDDETATTVDLTISYIRPLRSGCGPCFSPCSPARLANHRYYPPRCWMKAEI